MAHREDEEQYLIALAAAAMFAPILLLFWSNSAGLSTGCVLGAGLLHLLVLAGSVLAVDGITTAMDGVPSVDAATLRALLLSLEGSGGRLPVSSPPAHEVMVVFRHARRSAAIVCC